MDPLSLLIAADVLMLAVGFVYLGIPSVVYRRLYQVRYRKRYDAGYAPSLSIFIPCQGADERLANDVRAFRDASYPKARLFFIVESAEDPASGVIAPLIEDQPNIRLVVAGTASSRGQKNHNLLQGIKAAERKDEVYVFLDSITTITCEQLRAVIAPLSHPDVAASTGFRWDILERGTLGERLHAFMIGVQWSLLNSLLLRAAWGGCTAVRREDFEQLDIAGLWAETVVDDMALVGQLNRERRKCVFVPTCIKETASPVTTVRDAILWFKRQVLYIKFYVRFYWACALLVLLCCSANILSLPFLSATALIRPETGAAPFAVTTGITTLFAMMFALCLKRPAQDNHGNVSWFLLSPLFLVCTCAAFVLGIFSTVLPWRGIVYHLDRRGRVKRIERPTQCNPPKSPHVSETSGPVSLSGTLAE